MMSTKAISPRDRATLIMSSIFLLTLVTSFVGVQGEDPTASSLIELCKDKPLTLNSISQVRRLASELKSTGEDLCETYADSLKEIDYILASVESGRLCDREIVDLIRNYKQRFIN